MDEEKNIELRCGKKVPFTVPEGYFDNLTARVMANLPQENSNVISLNVGKKRSYWKEITTVAAACIAGAIVFINVHKSAENNFTADNQTVVYDEQYQQDMMEYAMIDASDVVNNYYLADGGY